MEELTEPLRKALEKGEPVRFRDPVTDRIYVLVREQVQDGRVRIAPGILRGKQAFLRELPSLLQNPKFEGWTVAYCGDEQVKLAPSESDVIRECLKRGLTSDEYYLGVVAPYDEDEEIEGRLSEFDPIED